MAAVFAPESSQTGKFNPTPIKWRSAAINGPQHCVISENTEAIEEICAILKAHKSVQEA
jgi:acyl transferase domain-containing protein